MWIDNSDQGECISKGIDIDVLSFLVLDIFIFDDQIFALYLKNKFAWDIPVVVIKLSELVPMNSIGTFHISNKFRVISFGKGSFDFGFVLLKNILIWANLAAWSKEVINQYFFLIFIYFKKGFHVCIGIFEE